MNNICIGAIVQKVQRINCIEWRAVIIYEDDKCRYTFERAFVAKEDARKWIDAHAVSMPLYYDSSSRRPRY